VPSDRDEAPENRAQQLTERDENNKTRRQRRGKMRKFYFNIILNAAPSLENLMILSAAKGC
jgi:hypothetical protein